MRILEIINEGGWATTATQNTTITPSTVKKVLPVVEKFINDFNKWLAKQNVPPMKMGHPLGSSAYYQQDDEDTEYGDIDLQVIAPDHPDQTSSQTAGFYNKLIDQYVGETKPAYIHYENKSLSGKPIFNVGGDFVQVDFVWATQKYADWARWRTTPERGLKGAVYGLLFSSLGEVMNTSIQGAGAQMKIVGDQPAPFAKTRKFDELVTLTSNIETLGLDILRWTYKRMGREGKIRLDPLLKANPGVDTSNIQAKQLVDMIKGLARSFELNDMYGEFNLASHSNADDFINAFLSDYAERINKAVNNTKFDKAETTAAKAKAASTKEKLSKGLDYITQLMKS